MGLACSNDGLSKLLGKPEPPLEANGHVPSAPSSAASVEEYSRFLADVAAEERRVQRRATWEAKGGWHVASAGGCVGLINMKNTCWLNSGLQCLLHLPPLVEAIFEKNCDTEQNGEPNHEAVENPKILAALLDLLQKVWQTDAPDIPPPLTPAKLRMELKHYAPWLVQRHQQQDAQEFLAFMLDALHSEMKTKPEFKAVSSDLEQLSQMLNLAEVDEQREECEAAWAWAHHLQNAMSPIVDIFRGQLRSLLTCQECGHFSRTFDPFLHLSVPVQPGSSPLSDALEAFASEECLSGSNSWACERCQRRVEATKRMELYKLPPVVMLHLKRFTFDQKAGCVKKVHGQIELDGGSIGQPVDLEMYTVSQQRGHALYDIIGIVNHHGSDANSGHYTATCYHCVEGAWYSFDDKRVTEIPASEAWIPDAAYVLFLMKRRIPDAESESKCTESVCHLDDAEDSPSRSVSFIEKYVTVTPQSVEHPEDWPHMCDLVGIRRQLQLFNYMPAAIDLQRLGEYRLAYQRFRTGDAFGAQGRMSSVIKQSSGLESSVAVDARGNTMPPPIITLTTAEAAEKFAALRTEYQRWRIAQIRTQNAETPNIIVGEQSPLDGRRLSQGSVTGF